MKTGIIALVGRPNAGKSTLLNQIIGQKVSITSPKPQTTRRLIQAGYQDKIGQIIFIDTPGIFAKVEDQVAAKINAIAGQWQGNVDLIIYLVDKTRSRGREENRILGMVRQAKVRKILVYNKIDIRKPDYSYEYKVYEKEFDYVMSISALKGKHIKTLIQKIFEFLPQTAKPLFDPKSLPPSKLLNINSRMFLADLIREKIFLYFRQETPYTAGVEITEIKDKPDIFYLKAKILAINDKYKKIIIGHKGGNVKQIGIMSRKELELVTNKKVYVDLEVETDKHWPERLLI